jgi:hypothetical protein
LLNLNSKFIEAFSNTTVELLKLMNNKLLNKNPFKCCEANPTGRVGLKQQQSCFKRAAFG